MNSVRLLSSFLCLSLLILISIMPPATEAQPPGSTLIVPIYNELTDPATGQIKQQIYSAADHGNWQLRVKAETASDFHCNHCKISTTPLVDGVEYILEPAEGELTITLKASGAMINPNHATVFANGKAYSIALKLSSDDKEAVRLSWTETLSKAAELYDSFQEEDCICPHKPDEKQVAEQMGGATESITITLKDLVANTATRPLFETGSLIDDLIAASTPATHQDTEPESLFPSTSHELCLTDGSYNGRQAARGGARRSNGGGIHIKIICYNKEGDDKDSDEEDEDDEDEQAGRNNRGDGGGRNNRGDGSGGKKSNFWKKHSWERKLFKNRYTIAGTVFFLGGAWITVAAVSGQCTEERNRAEQQNTSESFTCRSAAWAGPVFAVVGGGSLTLVGQASLLTAEILYHCYCKKRFQQPDAETASTQSQ